MREQSFRVKSPTPRVVGWLQRLVMCLRGLHLGAPQSVPGADALMPLRLQP